MSLNNGCWTYRRFDVYFLDKIVVANQFQLFVYILRLHDFILDSTTLSSSILLHYATPRRHFRKNIKAKGRMSFIKRKYVPRNNLFRNRCDIKRKSVNHDLKEKIYYCQFQYQVACSISYLTHRQGFHV